MHLIPFYTAIFYKQSAQIFKFNHYLELNYAYFWDLKLDDDIEKEKLIRLFRINNYLRKFIICIILVYCADPKT